MGSSTPPGFTVRAHINDNRTPAGTLQNGALTLRLDVRLAEWHPDGDQEPGMVLRAFGEEGKAPEIPGPLIRVPEGTEIVVSLHNTLDSTLFIHGLGSDLLAVFPRASKELRFRAGPPGTYFYWGSTRPGGLADRIGLDDELSGALIVDPAGATGR